jgi:hypothetical protein
MIDSFRARISKTRAHKVTRRRWPVDKLGILNLFRAAAFSLLVCSLGWQNDRAFALTPRLLQMRDRSPPLRRETGNTISTSTLESGTRTYGACLILCRARLTRSS